LVDPVSEQAAAYNAHDVDRFLACYTADAVLGELDGSELMRGHEDMRQQYSALFREHPTVSAAIPSRIRVGTTPFWRRSSLASTRSGAGSLSTIRPVS
jgi:hypothetical protein